MQLTWTRGHLHTLNHLPDLRLAPSNPCSSYPEVIPEGRPGFALPMAGVGTSRTRPLSLLCLWQTCLVDQDPPTELRLSSGLQTAAGCPSAGAGDERPVYRGFSRGTLTVDVHARTPPSGPSQPCPPTPQADPQHQSKSFSFSECTWLLPASRPLLVLFPAWNSFCPQAPTPLPISSSPGLQTSPSRKSSLTLSHIDSICSLKKKSLQDSRHCVVTNQSFSRVDVQVMWPCGLVPLSLPSQEPFGDRACGSSRCPPRMPNKMT